MYVCAVVIAYDVCTIGVHSRKRTNVRQTMSLVNLAKINPFSFYFWRKTIAHWLPRQRSNVARDLSCQQHFRNGHGARDVIDVIDAGIFRPENASRALHATNPRSIRVIQMRCARAALFVCRCRHGRRRCATVLWLRADERLATTNV